MTRQERSTAAAEWRDAKTLPVPKPRIDVTPERVLNIAIAVMAIISALVFARSAIEWLAAVMHRVAS